MAGGLIVPRHAQRRAAPGMSESEIMNLMAGLERVTDEQLAVLLSATLGEVIDRKGPARTLQSVRQVLATFEQTRPLVA